MTTFRVEFNSNGAPFVSDNSHVYLEAEDAMAAFKLAMANYKHPCGLYAAGVLDEKGNLVARWLSPRAHVSMKAPCGMHEWRGSTLYVNGNPQPQLGELLEEVAQP